MVRKETMSKRRAHLLTIVEMTTQALVEMPQGGRGNKRSEINLEKYCECSPPKLVISRNKSQNEIKQNINLYYNYP